MKTTLGKLIIIVIMIGLSGCSALGLDPASSTLTASGTIEADTVHISAEISGKITEIQADEGDTVKAGDSLVRLDDSLYQAEHDQAQASVQSATAALTQAQQKLSDAQVQANIALQNARSQDASSRNSSWTASAPAKFTLPDWYYQKSEAIAALNVELDTAQKDLENEQSNLATALKDASNQDFTSVEKRLEQAQLGYEMAGQTHTQAQSAANNTELVNAAQKVLDAAQSELDAAQQAYNQMLSTTSAKNVLEARARVAVAQNRLDNTQYALDQLMTGDDSLQVQAAQSAVNQAQASVDQAKAALAQTQAALKLAEATLTKTTLTAPTAGVVLSRDMSTGETTSPGAMILEIASLDVVKLTVYIPEDQYGAIKLGQPVRVSVDSFPGRTFTGTVATIADQAEFTPRNVQTKETRSTTVYAIQIRLPNPDHALKPGMPADAAF